tara:strand:+ start:306 stop:569 length:264 start_codon:yes stop_codon:yes gene_type:complete
MEKTDRKNFMENKLALERIKNLRGKRSYEEKKAAKLGFASLYDYFEDKVVKETQLAELEKQNKSLVKNKPVKKINQQERASCSCCSK